MSMSSLRITEPQVSASSVDVFIQNDTMLHLTRTVLSTVNTLLLVCGMSHHNVEAYSTHQLHANFTQYASSACTKSVFEQLHTESQFLLNHACEDSDPSMITFFSLPTNQTCSLWMLLIPWFILLPSSLDASAKSACLRFYHCF